MAIKAKGSSPLIMAYSVLVLWNYRVLSIWNCQYWMSYHVDHHSVSSRQLGWQQQMPDGHTSWDCVEAQRGNDAWQNEDVVNWTHQKLECSSLPLALRRRQLCTVDTSLNFTRSGTSSQWRSTCISCLRLRSNFLVSLPRRAAAFKRRCNLSVVALGVSANSTLQ